MQTCNPRRIDTKWPVIGGRRTPQACSTLITPNKSLLIIYVMRQCVAAWRAALRWCDTKQTPHPLGNGRAGGLGAGTPSPPPTIPFLFFS